MKNLLTLTFFVLFANLCVAENAFTIAPSNTKSDTIKPKRPIPRGVINPQQNTSRPTDIGRPNADDINRKAAEKATVKDALQPDVPKEAQKEAEKKVLEAIPKITADSTDPKAIKKAKKAAEKAAAEAKKAEAKRLKEEKEKKDPPKVHLFAWLSLGLGVVAVAGLIGYFAMPILGFLSASAILASIFGYLGSKKIKKEPLKWKGLPLTTFGGMSILALLAVAVIWLVGFFRANSGI